MANLYTESELSLANLPGYLEPAVLEQSLAPETDWQTVISLTIVSDDHRGVRVLDGIRRQDTNPTHPNVVSTPTGRVPKSLARTIIQSKGLTEDSLDLEWVLDEINPQKPLVVARLKNNLEIIPDHESSLPYAAGALLAGKLGCAAQMEKCTTDNPFGTVSLASVLTGFSYASDRQIDGELVPVFEPLVMLGTVVTLVEPDAVASTTESYREMSWVPIENYEAGVSGREARLLIPNITDEDEAGVCVRGLCLATTAANLEDIDLLREHLTGN